MLTRRKTLAKMAKLSLMPILASVPAVAQDRLALKWMRIGTHRIEYLIRYAGADDAPMLLCFGGGDANRGIAEYFDQVYTPEGLYQDHHVVLPIGPRRQRFFQFTNADARAFIDRLTKKEPIKGRGLIAGVSNGGRAAFRFARAAPEAFRGFITMPGAMGSQIVPREWRDYAIVLAYGTQDTRWANESKHALASLRGRVGAVELVALGGQGHVVGADYDIDPVYAQLKALETRLGR